jgi:hypothetical protein
MIFSLASISNAARAGDERLEYKLVTIGVDTKVSPASNIEGRILASGKYFGVAFYRDGKIAVKDFLSEGDLLKGIGIFRGYSTYTFQDGAGLTLSYVAESEPTATPSSPEQATTPSPPNGRRARRFSTSQSTSTLRSVDLNATIRLPPRPFPEGMGNSLRAVIQPAVPARTASPRIRS